MAPRRLIGRFLLGFAVAFGALVAPWPGWNAAYGALFRGGAAAVFSDGHGRILVRFRRAEHPPRAEIDTEIVVADRAQIGRDGRGPANVLGLDTRSVGWIPTALVLALIVATPVGWRRQWRALVLGLAVVHVYILLVVGVYLWNETAGAVPVSFLPYWAGLGGGLEETLVTQLGPSFAVPALIWVAVTFRREDWAGFGSRVRTGADVPPAKAGPP